MAEGLQEEAEAAGPGPGSERDQQISDAAKHAKRSGYRILALNMLSPYLQLEDVPDHCMYCCRKRTKELNKKVAKFKRGEPMSVKQVGALLAMRCVLPSYACCLCCIIYTVNFCCKDCLGPQVSGPCDGLMLQRQLSQLQTVHLSSESGPYNTLLSYRASL